AADYNRLMVEVEVEVAGLGEDGNNSLDQCLCNTVALKHSAYLP
ncbi:MAG: hypothetical protein K0R55_1647, partial [Sporomusa sp.]|nr:hypothetical protein [Sporomusa sp.]